MTWTKGNTKGEWEVHTKNNVYDYDVKIVGENRNVLYLDHTDSCKGCECDIDVCCDCGEERFHTMTIWNPADRRLFQLAPRMADAILEWLESLSYTDHIPEKLMEIAEELEQLKAGNDE